MSVPNDFTPNTRIESGDVDENFSDIAQEITGSLPINGVKAMAAPLPLAAGSVSLPGLTFSGDTDAGIYRIAADNIGVAVGGTKILDVASTGLTVTGAITTTGLISARGAVPVGAGMDFWGTAAPTGWLFAYGQVLDRTTYAALFAEFSTNFNTGGELGTEFRMPDKRGRGSFGKDDMGGSSANRLTNVGSVGINGDTLGDTGGEETHVLTIAELATVTPAGTVSVVNGTNILADGGNSGTTGANGALGNETAVAITASFTGTPFGSNTPHNTLPPGIVCNYIIYTGVA